MSVEDLNKILEVHGQLSDKRPMLFLDEIQNIKGWKKFARRIADNKFSVMITGSNAKMFSKDVTSVLGGRYITRDVFPFSFDEYLEINGVDPNNELLTATTSDRSILMRHFEEYFQLGDFLNVPRDQLNEII